MDHPSTSSHGQQEEEEEDGNRFRGAWHPKLATSYKHLLSSLPSSSTTHGTSPHHHQQQQQQQQEQEQHHAYPMPMVPMNPLPPHQSYEEGLVGSSHGPPLTGGLAGYMQLVRELASTVESGHMHHHHGHELPFPISLGGGGHMHQSQAQVLVEGMGMGMGMGMDGHPEGVVQEGGSMMMMGHRTQEQRESHILAERQRREEMNDKFTILRTIIPKLTKKDKASIVTDTINYIKDLERKLKYLQACKSQHGKGVEIKISEESSTSTSQPLAQDHANLEEKQLSSNDGGAASEVIEVQDMGNQAVIKIVSPRSRGLVLRLHLALHQCKVDVIQSNVTTIGDSVVHFVTIEFIPGLSASVEDLVKALRGAIKPR